MNYGVRSLLPLASVLLAACGLSGPAKPSPSSATSGAVAASPPFEFDLGVSDIRLSIGGADSVRWSIYTSPQGCALADVSSRRIREAERKRRCSVEWEVTMPAVADVTVDVSVGDIDVTAPSDRAVQLRTSVGDIRVRLDGRLVDHANAPGSGDRWTIGDVNATPRLIAKVDVGAIRLELKTQPGSR